jgi:hypothetical protein
MVLADSNQFRFHDRLHLWREAITQLSAAQVTWQH